MGDATLQLLSGSGTSVHRPLHLEQPRPLLGGQRGAVEVDLAVGAAELGAGLGLIVTCTGGPAASRAGTAAALATRLATRPASAAERRSVRTITNSSPPTRATVSPAASRCAVGSQSALAARPRRRARPWSLTCLNRSRSQYSTATVAPLRVARASARSIWSSTKRRFGSPVSGSCRIRNVCACSVFLRSVTSRRLATIPMHGRASPTGWYRSSPPSARYHRGAASVSRQAAAPSPPASGASPSRLGPEGLRGGSVAFRGADRVPASWPSRTALCRSGRGAAGGGSGLGRTRERAEHTWHVDQW